VVAVLRAQALSPAHQLLPLRGGARLVTAAMPARRSVAVAFMFAVGSRHEQPATAGLSHFVEHMVFKGGGDHPTARSISEAIESVGGSINASTDKEETVFYAKVPAEHLGLACEVLSDMLFRPRLDPDEVTKERQVVIEELRMCLDNPQEHVGTLFDEVMYPEQPLGWDVAGTEETVTSFQAADCRRHLGEHYRASRLVVSVAGAVEDGAAAAVVEPLVAALERDGAGPDAAPASRDPHGVLRVVSRRVEQANVMLGAHACSYRDPRRFVLDILNVVLGEGMSSRLFQELREERALVYDVHSFTSKLADTGCLGIYLGCEPRRAVGAVELAVEQLLRLASEPVPEEELARAKRYATGRLLLQLESTGAMCQYLGQQELLTGEILAAEEVVAAIERVTAAEVRAMAEAVCAAGLRAAVIGPFAKPERFERALARAG
jgi:predicted Zn-dependent peptidase